MLAVAVERLDHWGLVQAYLHSNGEGLPDESVQIRRPWAALEETTGRSEPKPKKDRYQKSRERAAFFGAYQETA